MLLITGGAGFAGLYLAEKLVSLGHKVRIFDMRTPSRPVSKKIEFFQGSVTDKAALSRALKGVTVAFNLASLLPCSRAKQEFKHVNVGGTINLLEGAVEHKVKKVVHVSSSIVYGKPSTTNLTETLAPQPIGDYGKSKLEAERHCFEYMKKGLPITILRPRMIIGAGRLGLLTILFDWIAHHKRIYLIGKGHNHFQMLGVHDFVDACVKAMKKGDNEIFNIGSDHVPSVRVMMKDLIRHAGSTSRVAGVPAFFARHALRLLDFFHLTPLNVEHYMIADCDYLVDTTKAKKILKWKPTTTNQEMMKEAYDWYFSHKDHLHSELASDLPSQGVLKLLRAFS